MNRRNDDPIYRRKTNLSKDEWYQFNYELNTLLENELSTVSSDECPDYVADKLTKSYQDLLDKFMPLQKLSRKEKSFLNKPWINSEIKAFIRKKDYLHKKARTTKNPSHIEEHRIFRNLLSKLKQDAHDEYYRKKIAESGEDKAKTWRLINEIVNRNKGKKEPIKHLVDEEGVKTESDEDNSNCLNRHFSTIAKNMASEFSNNSDAIEYLKHVSTQASVFLSSTDSAELLDILKNLDPKKSCGFDSISNRVLKETSFIIAPYLVRLFNICFEKAIFPKCFKTAKVTPLFKGGDKHDPNSYRPISLLPCLGKVLEKIIATRLIDFFDKHNLFSSCQFGFRKHYNTELAIADIYEKLLSNLDNRLTSCAIFLDLAKAFDTVNHSILLKKTGKIWHTRKSFAIDRILLKSTTAVCMYQ